MQNKTEIGQRLKEWIKSTGKKQKDIAAELGISAAQLSQYIIGDYKPGWNFLEKLESIGADSDWIMTGRKKDESTIEKGRVLAKYFIPKQYGVNKVIADVKSDDDGYNVTVYEVIEQKSVMAKAAEPTVDYGDEVESIPQVIVGRLKQPLRTVAATPLYHKKEEKE